MSSVTQARSYVGRALGCLLSLLALLAAGSPPTLAQTRAEIARAGCSIPGELALVRPHAEGLPVAVEVEVVLIDLFEIDDANQSFLADVVLSLRWNDPRLSSAVQRNASARCKVGMERIWHPDIRALNQRTPLTRFEPQAEIHADGSVVATGRTMAAFSSALDLRRFPFDTQELRIKLASFSYGPSDVEFTARQAQLEGDSGWSLAGWSVRENFTVVDLPPLSVGTEQFTRVEHVVRIERRPGYVLWVFVLPLSFIVLMAWTVFWLDPASPAPQIGVATAATFTLIAFLIALRARLPEVEYLTRLDKLSVYSTALVFAALGEVILTSWLTQRDQLALARRVDFHARWVYLLAFLTALALLLAT